MYEKEILKKVRQYSHVALMDKLGFPDNVYVGLLVVKVSGAAVDGHGKSFDDVAYESFMDGLEMPGSLCEPSYEGYERKLARMDGSNLADNVEFEILEGVDDTVYAIGYFDSLHVGEPMLIQGMYSFQFVREGDVLNVSLTLGQPKNEIQYWRVGFHH